MNPPDVAMHNNESQARGPAVLKMKGQASTIGTFMNNVVFSSFWLSAPYAFAETGWVLGIIFLTVTLTTSWVTGLMYGRLVNDRYQELLDHRNRELESRPPGNNRGVAPKVKGSPKEMDPETTPNGAVNLCSSTEFSKAPEDGIGTMATRASEFSTGAAQSHEVDEEVTLSAMYADALGARVGPIIGDFICILNFVPASAGEMILCGQLLELLFPDVMEIGYWILIVGLYSFFAYMIPNLETLEKASWLFGIFLISSAVFMITGTVLSIKANDPVTSSEYGGQDALSIFNGLGVFAFIFGGMCLRCVWLCCNIQSYIV
ncbi:hypothetical protein SARC_13884 [Sphaeroforma arctica JP610]|uniref:Amino acid transporter transmembrane domain-containing protein n=1 Tax=Sphaeroforma arctica JP610 TaxID=667725 RepID=A0A0L0FAL0_9EUKA|nr:hypothetical protein SARC_13884 [Sphaeroforma arctica JP610]KNC73556.1 hypothetical protein SARC_13884 [Sphaeroforma arctica JP610]|eukprot:XP_014147458.1 hypothetical protein SARC_13884 [Sphaeroforma arctica JP610]